MINKKLNIAIIAGGFSNEREISLMTASQIAKFLSKDKYAVKIIEITPKKTWVIRHDIDEISIGPMDNELAVVNNNLDRLNINESIDVAFLALHGKFGEDGRIQAMLDYWQIPYTGSGVLASAIGMNKLKCIEVLNSYGIKVAPHIVVTKRDADLLGLNHKIRESINYPVVVKPNESGSSVGVSIVKDFDQLKTALEAAFKEDNIILLEKFISGRELTCAVLGNTRDKELLALPPVEIITEADEFFDYQNKYFSGKTQDICPADIGPKLTEEIKQTSKRIHTILGCDGLTRSDYILHDGELYFLEINTIPGLTEVSLAPRAAKAIGWTFAEFLEKQIELARQKFFDY